MWRGIVFHMEGPTTEEALSPFCVLVGGTTRRVLLDAGRVTGPYGGLDKTFKLSDYLDSGVRNQIRSSVLKKDGPRVDLAPVRPIVSPTFSFVPNFVFYHS